MRRCFGWFQILHRHNACRGMVASGTMTWIYAGRVTTISSDERFALAVGGDGFLISVQVVAVGYKQLLLCGA